MCWDTLCVFALLYTCVLISVCEVMSFTPAKCRTGDCNMFHPSYVVYIRRSSHFCVICNEDYEKKWTWNNSRCCVFYHFYGILRHVISPFGTLMDLKTDVDITTNPLKCNDKVKQINALAGNQKLININILFRAPMYQLTIEPEKYAQRYG